MGVTTEAMQSWLETLLGGSTSRPLQEFLDAIPALDALADVPAGTPVLIRGDVDAKPGATVGEGDVRLRSMEATLRFGIERGWKQVIFGHIGRKPEGSLDKVAARLSEILGRSVSLVTDWFDAGAGEVKAEVAERIATMQSGDLILLENTRAYDIERMLWKAKPADIPQVVEPLTKYAASLVERVAKIYIHEAFSAGSLDSSSVVAPVAMDRVAMGKYEEQEFSGPLKRCLDAEMVIFSGIKTDKLDDLQAMIDRGRVKRILSAGSLAMALKKGSALADGGDFDLGATENAKNEAEPWYIPPKRIEQARNMVIEGRKKGIEFILPVDFTLGDERVVETLSGDDQQFDIGPKSSALYEEKIGEVIAAAQGRSDKLVVFHNGVFGMFEDSRFERGTKHFVGQLKRMHDAGIEVFVGGGEGGKALEQYGEESWVTHSFTAGGTVLNALGSEPVPYLVALAHAAH